MIKYKIEYNYDTGDSFNNNNETDTLEHSWETIECVKVALNRIAEHYKWYVARGSTYSFSDAPEQPKWHNNKYSSNITLLLNNGNEWSFDAPWCGYFEQLKSIKVIIDDDELEVTF